MTFAVGRSMAFKARGGLTAWCLLAGLAAGAAASGGDDPLAWKRGAADVVVRYEISGGGAAREGTGLPDRTVYGDGLVVWTEPQEEPTPGCASSVWTGRLDPETIRGLLRLAVDAGFFELEGSYWPAAATPPAPGEDPIPLPLDSRAETLTLSLADRSRRVTVRPAGWAGAPAAFRQPRDAVLRSVPADARRFVPRSYRLLVTPLPAEDAGDHPELPRALGELDLAGPEPLRLGREEGEALAAALAELGATVAHNGRVFALRLFAEPPRAP